LTYICITLTLTQFEKLTQLRAIDRRRRSVDIGRGDVNLTSTTMRLLECRTIHRVAVSTALHVQTAQSSPSIRTCSEAKLSHARCRPARRILGASVLFDLWLRIIWMLTHVTMSHPFALNRHFRPDDSDGTQIDSRTQPCVSPTSPLLNQRNWPSFSLTRFMLLCFVLTSRTFETVLASPVYPAPLTSNTRVSPAIGSNSYPLDRGDMYRASSFIDASSDTTQSVLLANSSRSNKSVHLPTNSTSHRFRFSRSGHRSNARARVQAASRASSKARAKLRTLVWKIPGQRRLPIPASCARGSLSHVLIALTMPRVCV